MSDRQSFWSMDVWEGVNHDPQSLHKYLYAQADPVSHVDPSGKGPLTLTESMLVSALANVIATEYAYIRSQFTANPWSVPEFLLKLFINAAGGAVTGGVAFKAGMLVKFLWPSAVGALVAGVGSGTTQLVNELTDFYLLDKPITFTDARGRVLRATATGLILGGILTKIEIMGASGAGYEIKSLPPAATVLPLGDAAKLATAGGVSGYAATAIGGPPILEYLLKLMVD